MIDFETVKFISILNDLARRSANGFLPIAQCNRSNSNLFVFYDNENNIIIDFYFKDKEFQFFNYKPLKIDGVSFKIDKDDEGIILILQLHNHNEDIIICDGLWYFYKQNKDKNIKLFFE